MSTERWLTVAGLVTWIVSALPTLLRIVNGNMSPGGLIAWAIAFPLFGLVFGLMCLDRPGVLSRAPVRIGLLALQSLAGLTMTSFAPDIFPAATLVVVAGQLDEMPQRVAAAWIAVQTIALVWIGSTFANAAVAVAIGGAFGGFQTFAYVTASLTRRERLARQELAQANMDLVLTRVLLEASSRNEERLRISRDLHDTIGHHLTALSLQLDVASRLTEGKAAEHVDQAHAIARLLLSDLRVVVSELRSGTRFDLGRAIRRIAAGTSELAIHLELHEIVEIGGARADAVLHCVQEIVTNTMRHAAARNLWITVALSSDVMILARDDGHGAKVIVPGNGLTGMRERFETLGGRIEFRSEGRGFVVDGFLPSERSTT